MPRVKNPCVYDCQYDNTKEPGGTCNVTSLGMVLRQNKRDQYVPGAAPRVADRLTQYCYDHGMDRHALETIDALAEKFGLIDNSSKAESFDHVKTHLASSTDHLVIVHGYFTPSGHIMVIRGFDTDKGVWICNDPAGQYDPVYHYSGPDWKPGEGVEYNSEWFRNAAAPDGMVWAHLIAKKG